METEITPALVLKNGNYDAVVAALGNQMGTVWNAWQTTWSGVIQQDDGTVAPVPFTGEGGPTAAWDEGDDNDDDTDTDDDDGGE
jgi:hypothetical protein